MLANAPFPMEPILGFGWVSIFLIIGLWLRAKVPLFRRYLIPACLIGGTIGFLCNFSGLLNATGLGVSSKTLQIIAYHLFNMTWVLLGLQKPIENNISGAGRGVKNTLWMASATVSTMALSLVGVLALGMILKYFGYTGPTSLGILVSMGFFGGPGQTMTVASIWEGATHATGYVSFGLAGASTGYLMAMVIGIPLMNIICRRYKRTTFSLASVEERRGYYGTSEKPVAGSQTTVTTAIETLSWHLGLGIAIYIAVLFIYGLLGKVLPPKAMAMLWALLFLVAMIMAMLVRRAMGAIKIDHLVCRNMNNRVNGFMVDFLVCATFISIQVGAVETNLMHFIFSCILALALTTGLLWLICRNVDKYGVESFGMLFGTLTGTISTGLILMRIVDPNCETPVARTYGFANILSFPFFLVLTIFANWEVVLGRSPWVMLFVFAAWGVVGVVVTLLTRPGKFFTGDATGMIPSSCPRENT